MSENKETSETHDEDKKSVQKDFPGLETSEETNELDSSEIEKEAEIMEKLEIKILNNLNIDNPYK